MDASHNTAFLFAGQGAQFVGMGADMAQAEPACSELFSRADTVLGWSISKICFNGPENELSRSDICQPAVFLVSAVALALLRSRMPELAVAACAGLSLGEWTALYAAGVLSFEDALRILEARGRFMQEACEVNPGAMASIIGLTADALQNICAETGVWAANFNSPEQTVLSGTRSAIERAAAMAREKGAKKTVILNVAGAYHSPLMAPAAEKLERFLEQFEFKQPVVPVVSNVTGKPHESAASIKQAMPRQIVSPVLWTGCVESLRGMGICRYVELGPGKVLSGLVKRIVQDGTALNVQDMPSLEKAVVALRG